MSKVTINGNEYICHSYNKKDAYLGHSLIIIIEGAYKPAKSNLTQIERSGDTFNSTLVLYHNYDDIAKIYLFKGEY